MKQTNEIQKSKMGRPTKYNEVLVKRLEDVFQLDVTQKTACRYVGLSQDTFIRWMKEKPDFSERIAKAKEYARIASGSVVKEAIEKKDVQTARWWLEKKHPDEFYSGAGTNIAVQGEKVMVIPSELMTKYGIEQSNPATPDPKASSDK